MATSQWLVIEGPAGMGKTRLVGVARAAARTAGLEVLTARAGELEQEFAFGVVRQLFEPLLARASADERAEFTADAAGLALPLFQRPGPAGWRGCRCWWRWPPGRRAELPGGAPWDTSAGVPIRPRGWSAGYSSTTA